MERFGFQFFDNFTKQKDDADRDLWENAEDEWLDYDSDNDPEEAADEVGAPPKDQDPLYNDAGDEADAKWVEEKLMAHLTKGGRPSDAVLNCPCCFALLCVDCQRHDTFVNQFRAMFVRNCKVYHDRELRYRRQEQPMSNRQRKKLQARQNRLAAKKQKQQKQAQTAADGQPMDDDDDEEDDESLPPPPERGLKTFESIDKIMVEDEPQYYPEVYFPVHCARCDTEVGVFESDVYHFFHTVPTD